MIKQIFKVEPEPWLFGGDMAMRILYTVITDYTVYCIVYSQAETLIGFCIGKTTTFCENLKSSKNESKNVNIPVPLKMKLKVSS